MHYVVGFLFDDGFRHVALIQKAKPQWQRGRLNGIGGAVESTDGGAFEAVVREFEEETTVEFRGWWNPPFASMLTLHGDRVDFYAGASTTDLARVKTPEGSPEKIVVANVVDLMRSVYEERDEHDARIFPVPLPNVVWLVQMAISFSRGERSAGFSITEIPTAGRTPTLGGL